MRWTVLLALLAGLAHAQETDDEEGCGETEIIVSGDGEEGSIDIVVDPFHQDPPERPELNRPRAVKVGSWPPPALDAGARREMERLQGARDGAPQEKGHRYRLAEFYLQHGWYPHAEKEFLEAARLDPGSIRPWEGLLRVYGAGGNTRARPVTEVIIRIGGARVITRSTISVNDWLSSPLERNLLITRAFLELLQRRPDELARRREFVSHLKAMGDFPLMAKQAREALRQLEGNADMRYLLAEALRRIGLEREPDKQGLGTPEWTESVKQHEENLRRNPDHLPTILRLVRMLCHEQGNKVAERVTELERRAFFRLFVLEEIAPVPFRKDTLRVATGLAGARVASRLWDDAMGVAGLQNPWDPDRKFFDRWVFLAFPNTRPRERRPVIEAMARRGDEAMAGLLLALLWHMPHAEDVDPREAPLREETAQIEAMALEALGGLGPAAYEGARRFLERADTVARRWCGVQVLSALRDPRAVNPLLETLAVDRHEKRSLGAAGALERIGDKRAIDGLVDAALDLRRPAARRREAIEALAVFLDPRAVEAMKRLAKEPEFELVTSYGMFRLAGDGAALERLRASLVAGGMPGEVLRLAAKCHSPRVEPLFYDALEKCDPMVHPTAVAILKRRFWKTAEPRVRALFLRRARGRDFSEFTMKMLGELGGDEVAQQLRTLLSQASDAQWERVARALAETGHALAVRHFNRMRILERTEKRRELARELYAHALKRQAQHNKAARGE